MGLYDQVNARFGPYPFCLANFCHFLKSLYDTRPTINHDRNKKTVKSY